MNTYETKSFSQWTKGNSYIGRGILLGLSEDGKNAVSCYFIMGRSTNSRNRVFVPEGDDLMIKAYDEALLEDPSLIIYYPVRTMENCTIVTNGDQTDTIYEYLKGKSSFVEALRSRTFEPDAPNFTPRISGLMDFSNDEYCYKLSILKSSDSEGSACNRYFFDYSAISGLGHLIHTYNCDGNPIPTFTGEPKRVKLGNDIDALTEEVWDSLDPENKVSLYVRFTDLETKKYESRLINKNGD